ncbi:MAG: peptidyl-prolyl cis-trans isomerase, partial [Clostridia bacterium]|nr:peptidyl-prolyl cis-trans isomerase [Deltaproteobacteria bacterium]
MFRAQGPKFQLAAAIVLVTACSNKLPDSQLAARVNGEPITKTDFESAADRNLSRYRNQGQQLQPNVEARIRDSVLRRMIDDKANELEAKKLQIVVSDADLDAKYQEQKSRFRTDEDFKNYLTRSQMSEAQLKDDLRRNVLRDRLIEKLSGEIAVTEDDVKKYYEENIARFKERDQIKASRILIRVLPTAPEVERKKAKSKAQQIVRDAKRPNADFAKLARDNSNGPEAAKGGDLGMVYRGRLGPEFDGVAFDLKPGDVSDVVETKSGYEVVRVEEKKEERTRPLEEVADTIRTTILARRRNEKRREVLDNIRANTKIEQLIHFDTAGGPPAVGLDPHAPRLPGPPGGLNLPPGEPRLGLPGGPGALGPPNVAPGETVQPAPGMAPPGAPIPPPVPTPIP